jgi:hypothetical protein
MSIDAGAGLSGQPLPELARVPWRQRTDESHLARSGRLWTLTTLAHTVPLAAAALVLAMLNPITIPVGVILLVHAWMIPALYARRGANVLRARRGRTSPAAERVAAGLLADLVDHEPRELHRRTGLVLERAELGTWLVGEIGAVLIRRGGRRVNCYCVKPVDSELPRADGIAHLLLALRADECGFVTVANLAFSGAPWRLRRQLRPTARAALDAARRHEHDRG